MEKKYTGYLYEFFKPLVTKYGFQITTELNDEQSYMIEYSSGSIAIKIEKYFREFYVTVYNINSPDYEIAVFNLLEYLIQGDPEVPKSESFLKEKDIEECYKKQFAYISSVIYENYYLINDFFSGDDYEVKRIELERYWKNKHPEFYKKA